jgi:hypothetical protein
VWVAILAFTILVIATNAGLIGISRLSYSLACNDLFPGVFSKLHPRFRTPFVSIIVFGIVAALLIVPAQIDLMASVYSLAATFAFATAHLAVMRLRFVEPHLRRPFRMPFNVPFRRSSIPLLSVIGALAIGAVFTQLFFQDIQGSTFIFLGWLGTGVVIFIVYRTVRRRSLWQPLAAPPPAAAHHGPPLADRSAEPYVSRVRVGRLHPKETVVAEVAHSRGDRLVAFARSLRSPRRALAAAGVAALAGAAVLAAVVGRATLGPFGSALGWVPGVVLIAVIAAVLLLRGHDER